MPNVSIIVRSFNDIRYIEKTLQMIMGQAYHDFELINVDSGSGDGTFEIVRKYNPSAYQIRPQEYKPGKVLNDAIRRAGGEIIVFNNSDCIPQNQFWLQNLIRPFMESENIVATFGNQIPRKDAKPLVVKDNTRAFGDGSISSKWSHFFSLATSAARKSTLLQHPFNSEIQYSEDVEWSYRMKLAGYQIKYVPDAIVEHSHNYTWPEVRKRFYNEGLAEGKIYGTKTGMIKSASSCLREIVRDISYLVIKKKVSSIPSGIIYRVLQRYNLYKGRKDYFTK